MSATYVRSHYGVDYKRGDRLIFDGRPGTLVSFPGAYLGIRLDGDKHVSRCHPTWRIEREPHEFDEDVSDGSMCICGIPALTHDAVSAAASPVPTRGPDAAPSASGGRS